MPYLYPTAEGGIQAEWSLAEHEITLEIDIDRHHGEWHALDMKSEAENTRTLDLTAEDGWHWVANEIGRLSGNAA